MSKASLELGGTNWAAKDGNLLGYANGSFVDRYVPREFTFSRGSNLAATRINSAGKIEKGRENLLTYSNQFDNSAWNKVLCSVTGGQADKDGGTSAWNLEITSTSTFQWMQYSRSSTAAETISIYAKANTSNWIAIYATTSSNTCWFDLSTGTKGTQSSAAVATTIEPAGNGFYRISYTLGAGINNPRIFVAEDDGLLSVVAGDSIYIQDAQLEVGLVATNYIESGATTATAGLLENEPRIDYTGGTPSLMLEPSRANLIEYSEYFDSYVKSDTSILTNQAQSPEGLVNASLIAETATNSNHYLGLTTGISVVSGTTYTFSVFVKKGDGATAPDYCQLTFNFAGFGAIYANFNLSNGTIGTSSGVTPLISDSTINGFWRCSITATATSTANTGAIIAFTNNNNLLGRLPSYLGNTSSDFYAYGFQVEEGSYPTSYIPTYGTSATRAQGSGQLDPLDRTYGDDSTWFFELQRVVGEDELNQEFAIIANSLTGTNNFLQFSSTNNGRIRIRIADNSGTVENLYTDSNAFVRGVPAKIALKFNASGASFFIDGVKVATSSTLGVTTGIDKISALRKSIVKQLVIFPTALSDTDCITLTT